MMRHLKKPLAFILAFCMALSLAIPGFAAESGDNTATDEIDDTETSTAVALEETPAVIDEEDEGNVLELYVSNADEFASAFSTNYNSYDLLKVYLTENIEMSSTVTKVATNHVVLDGQGHTLTGPSPNFSGMGGTTGMFVPQSTSNYIENLTIQNITLDANENYIINYSSGYYWMKANIKLSDVLIENASSISSSGSADNAYAPIRITVSSYSTPSLTLENVTTRNCYGTLLSVNNIEDVTISNCDLTTEADSNMQEKELYAIYTGTSGKYMTIENSTISHAGLGGIYLGNNWTLDISGTTLEGDGTADREALYLEKSGNAATLNNCIVQNTDGEQAVIQADNGSLYIDGDIQGEPIFRLNYANGTLIQVKAELHNTLWYDFSDSISGEDPTIAIGAGDYRLTEGDNQNLQYTNTKSVRTQVLDEETNSIILYSHEWTGYEISIEEPDDWDNGIPVYERDYRESPVEPKVEVRDTEGNLIDASHYTVEYTGETEVTEKDEEDDIKEAKVTVTPTGDLWGDPWEQEYEIRVVTFASLDGPDAQVEAEVLMTSEGTSVSIKYNGTTLTEDVDYVLVCKQDTVNNELVITVTGIKAYGGTLEWRMELPSENIKIRLVSDEETLNEALEDEVEQIYITKDIEVDDPVAVDYDCTITSEESEDAPFSLRAGALETVSAGSSSSDLNGNREQAVLDVKSGSVNVSDIIVDGNDQARCLYVGSGADVTLNDEAVVTKGGYTGSGSSEYGLGIYVDEDGTLTLNECQVREITNKVAVRKIYNLGTMNVNEGAYLTALGCTNSAIQNLGILNWDGGCYDVNNTSGWFNNPTLNLETGGGGCVIENKGTFNMTAGMINGYLLDENGKYDPETSERSTAVMGAVQNVFGGTFNMSGGTIQGFCATGFSSFGTGIPSGGGGVFNYGIFNMSGDALITGNRAGSTDSSHSPEGSPEGSGGSGSSEGLAGGGVYNGGIFNMSGGTITNNEAAAGAGVYNDTALTLGGKSSGGVSGTTDASQFYMTGGTISGNKLTADKLEEQESETNMMRNSGVGVSTVGSEVYISGGSTVVISDEATVSDGAEVKVENVLNGSESESETLNVGIAVAPVNGFSDNDTGTINSAFGGLTVTGDPMISAGIVVVNYASETIYAEIDNLYDLRHGIKDPTNLEDYEWTPISSETSESSNISWLYLNGSLQTENLPLAVNTLNIGVSSVQFTNAGGTAGTNIMDGFSTTGYAVNANGSVVARYADRVEPQESDGKYLTSDADLYMTHVEKVLTYTQNNRMDEEPETYTETLEFEGWVICRHEDGLAYVEETAPTCTEPGYNAHYVCEICGALFEDEYGEVHTTLEDLEYGEPTGHVCVAVGETEPTCTEDGHVGDCYQCQYCGKLFWDVSGEEELTEAEATMDGELDALGHDWQAVDGTAATCTEPGLTPGIRCSREGCGEWKEGCEQTVIDPIGHDLTEHKAVSATCTESGNIEYWSCSNCGKLFADAEAETELTDVITPATGHDPERIAGYAATCTESGMTDGMQCSVCGTVLIPQETINAMGHHMTYVAAESSHIAYYVCDTCGRFFADENGTKELTLDDIIISGGTTSTEPNPEPTPEPDQEHYTGFKEENGSWNYYIDDVFQSGLNSVIQGTVNGSDGWWYVIGGKAQTGYTGVCDYSNEYGWWYVKNGKVDFGRTGIEQNSYGWWRVVGGKVDFSCNSVEQNDYGWWYVVGGKVDFSYTGVGNYSNDYGWWYISGGKVDFSKNSVEQNSYGWWYVVGGKVDFSYTGVGNYSNDYGWWYISGGKVDFSKNSVEQNSYGWWYVSGGKVDFSYTGLAANSYGTWYIKAGKVDFSYNGTYNGRTITAGKAV